MQWVRRHKKALNLASAAAALAAVAVLLIRHGARSGEATLLAAAYTDDYALARLLVEEGGDFSLGRNRGAAINATCRGGETPLKWAHYGDNRPAIDYLRSVGGVQE
jgi:hypothetical protein